MPDDETTALTAWRQAIAETNQVRAAFATHGHQETALAHAEHWELRKGRAYLAARDASVAALVTEDDPGLHLSHTKALGVTACGRWRRGDMLALSDRPTCPDCAAYLERRKADAHVD